jgi:hypothetical protein
MMPYWTQESPIERRYRVRHATVTEIGQRIRHNAMEITARVSLCVARGRGRSLRRSALHLLFDVDGSG